MRFEVVTTSGRKRYSLNDEVTDALFGLSRLTSIGCGVRWYDDEGVDVLILYVNAPSGGLHVVMPFLLRVA